MNPQEFAELVPFLIAEKLEDSSTPVPLVGGEIHESNPAWTFRTGPVLTLALILPRSNELRLTCGLAIDVPYSAELFRFVNYLNHKQLVFGRAFLVDNLDPTIAAVLTQEIVYGDGVSWDYPPSIQNLLRIIGTLSGQASRLGPEIASRFQAKPFSDADAALLLGMG